MSSNRVVLGKYNDGVTFGLRVSLPGIDALTGDSSGGDFSFDSSWTDIVHTLQIGLVTFASGNTVVSFVNPGYIPYVEAHLLSGNSVYDDYYGTFTPNGAGNILTPSNFTTSGAAGAQFIYIVYKIPVMSG